MNYRLQKNERLHSKKSIKELFEKGSSFFLYPFKVVYLPLGPTRSETNQVLFSVSKRKIRRAIDRNYIKRRMKEGYRLNKGLISSLGVRYKIAFIYLAPGLEDFHTLQAKVQKALEKIANQINQTSNGKQ